MKPGIAVPGRQALCFCEKELSVLNSGLPLTAVSDPKDCTTLRYSGIEFAEIRVFFENEFVPDVQSQCLLARSMRNWVALLPTYFFFSIFVKNKLIFAKNSDFRGWPELNCTLSSRYM